jgi:hypothetical protein
VDGAPVEDSEEEASAAAIGSPQIVSAWVGNPPSLGTTGMKGSGGKVTLRETLAGPRGPAEIDDDSMASLTAGLPVDRFSLCVDDKAPEWLLFPWRPFCCPDLGTDATSESDPVDRSLRIEEVVVRALVVLRVSHGSWYGPGAGDRAPADTSSLAEEVGVHAALRVFADGRCQGAGGWALAGASLTDVAAERTPAAPRASPGLTNGADAWAPAGTATSPHSVGAALDRALTLLAVGANAGCCRLAAAVP